MGATGSIFVLGSFVAACSIKVDRLPKPGESLRGQTFTLEAGGKGFNLAVGARRLGASVDGLLAVGDDLFATLAEGALTRADLPAHMLVRYPGMTGAGVAFVDADGENCLAIYPGANLRLTRQDVLATMPRAAAASLVLAQFEIDDGPIAEAFALARTIGRTTILNPSPYRSLAPEILRTTSILVVNRLEALHLGEDLGLTLPANGLDIVDTWRPLAEHLLSQGLETLIITLGAAGAVAWRAGSNPLLQPPFQVAAIDTLGAGDAFTAGLAATLAGGGAFEDGLRVAAACGALATTRLGVFDALPTLGELTDFIAASSG